MQRKPFILQNPSTLIVLAGLAVFTVAVTALSQAYGTGALPTSMVKVLGKTLCLALAAVAMDLVWGYLGILSLGQMAFFALGGYMIGQWLMYARTEAIVAASMANNAIPPTPLELQEGVANQIFGVVGSADLPLVWSFAHSLPLQMLLVLAVPGLLALVFGWLAFRSRVNGVYLSILTQAMTLALALWLFQNDSGFRVCRTFPASTPCRKHGCRSGSCGPRPSRWVWAICWPHGWSAASSAASSAPSAMTRLACVSLAIRSRVSSWWFSRWPR